MAEAPETIGLVSSPLGYRLWNRDDDTIDTTTIRYVRADRIEALERQLAEARAARDEAIERAEAAEFATHNGMSLSEDAIHAIRERLNEAGVPLAAFIDDHMGNAIAQRDAAEAERDRLAADNARLREALERLLNPAPGVKKLPPWVYGIAKPTLAGKE